MPTIVSKELMHAVVKEDTGYVTMVPWDDLPVDFTQVAEGDDY